MGKAIEVITAQVTAPGASLVAMAAVTGNSFTVRDTRKKAEMIALWAKRQTGGATRIVSPSLHDNSIGIQQFTLGAATSNAIFQVGQPLRAQDTLTVTGYGSATAGDIEQSSYLVYYDDLPGIDGMFINSQQLRSRGVNLYDNQITIATGTGGGYSGQVAVNSAQDAFKANTDYALIGISNAVLATTIRVVGPDWGNLGVGCPGFIASNELDMSRWFCELSDLTGKPCIPVMNSANKALTLIDAAQDENGADPIVVLHWVELA